MYLCLNPKQVLVVSDAKMAPCLLSGAANYNVLDQLRLRYVVFQSAMGMLI